MSMLLKIANGKEIHLYNGKIVLGDVLLFVRKVFKQLPTSYTLHYFDDEGDKIMVNTS